MAELRVTRPRVAVLEAVNANPHADTETIFTGLGGHARVMDYMRLERPAYVLVLGTADDGSLRSFCHVPDQRRVFRRYQIGRRAFRPHLLVAKSDTRGQWRTACDYRREGHQGTARRADRDRKWSARRINLGDFRCGRPESDRAPLRPDYLQCRS